MVSTGQITKMTWNLLIMVVVADLFKKLVCSIAVEDQVWAQAVQTVLNHIPVGFAVLCGWCCEALEFGRLDAADLHDGWKERGSRDSRSVARVLLPTLLGNTRHDLEGVTSGSLSVTCQSWGGIVLSRLDSVFVVVVVIIIIIWNVDSIRRCCGRSLLFFC